MSKSVVLNWETETHGVDVFFSHGGLEEMRQGQ